MLIYCSWVNLANRRLLAAKHVFNDLTHSPGPSHCCISTPSKASSGLKGNRAENLCSRSWYSRFPKRIMTFMKTAVRELFGFIFKLTQVFNNATAAAWLTGNTRVSAMQNQPMMNIHFKLFWHHF